MSTLARRPEATLHIRLDSQIGTHLDYDAATGRLDARSTVKGVVWNAQDSGPRFEGARVAVEFLNAIDERMTDYAREQSLPGACGNIEIARELETESFTTSDGEVITFPPINLWIAMDGQSFGSVEHSLVSCMESKIPVLLKVRFSHRAFVGWIIALRDLELYKKSSYPIVGFSLDY